MLREGLNFTLITGDKLHLNEISQGLSTIRVKTHFNNFFSCEDLVDYVEEDHSPFYHVIMLDMDNPEGIGWNCLKAIRSDSSYANKIIIAYSRVEDPAVVNRIFVEGGNIFFRYPKDQKEFQIILKRLVLVNWKIYLTGISRRNFILKL